MEQLTNVLRCSLSFTDRLKPDRRRIPCPDRSYHALVVVHVLGEVVLLLVCTQVVGIREDDCFDPEAMACRTAESLRMKLFQMAAQNVVHGFVVDQLVVDGLEEFSAIWQLLYDFLVADGTIDGHSLEREVDVLFQSFSANYRHVILIQAGSCGDLVKGRSIWSGVVVEWDAMNQALATCAKELG